MLFPRFAGSSSSLREAGNLMGAARVGNTHVADVVGVFSFSTAPLTAHARDMKLLPFFLALAFTARAALADLVIEQKLESPVQSGNITVKMKGDNVRVDMPASPMGPMSTVMNVRTGDTLSLIHSQKMAMKVSAAQTKAMLETMKQQQQSGGAAESTAPKLVATGKTEKVGAYDAEIYTWSGGGTTQTLWVAKDFPNFESFKEELTKLNKAAASGVSKDMQPDYSALPGMVVKTVAETAGMTMTTTLISVKREPVDDALFDAPADYKNMATPALPGAVQTPK